VAQWKEYGKAPGRQASTTQYSRLIKGYIRIKKQHPTTNQYSQNDKFKPLIAQAFFKKTPH